MATIASLSASLKADVNKFSKGMKKARRSLKKFSSFIPGANLNVGKFGLAITAVAAGALVLLTKRSLESIDATAKLADRLGTTTEALQELRFAASQTGVDAETLNKSLEKLSKVLGEAAQGLGTGKDGLKALGVELDSIIGKDPAEQFKIIAGEIAKLSTQEEKAAIAAQLFGRAGQKLLNTLDLGAEGLAKMAKEARLLGLTFNRIDAKTVEEANDAFDKLFAILEGVGNVLAVKVAPFIKIVSDRLVEFGTAGGGISELVNKNFESFLVSLAKAADLLSLLTAGWNLFSATARSALGALITPLSRLLEQLGSVADALGIENEIGSFVSAFKTDLFLKAAEDLEQARTAFNNFERGLNESKVLDFIAEARGGINISAGAAAGARAGEIRGGLAGVSPGMGREAIFSKAVDKLVAVQEANIEGQVAGLAARRVVSLESSFNSIARTLSDSAKKQNTTINIPITETNKILKDLLNVTRGLNIIPVAQ